MRFRVFDRQPEEDLFARVPEGWTVTLGKRSYLVNDAQKAELLARLVRWRWVWAVLLMVMIAPFSVMLAGLGRFGFHEWPNLAALAFATLFVFLYVFVAIPCIRLFVLHPVVRGARPVPAMARPARDGFGNSLLRDYRRQADSYSSPFLVFAVLLFGSLSIHCGYTALTSGAHYVRAIGDVFVTVNLAVVLFLKWRGGRSQG